jgi:hypothetical protein
LRILSSGEGFPVLVRMQSPASPKSITFTCPWPVNMMLAGLRSRWISLAVWASSMVSAISPAMRSAAAAPIRPPGCGVERLAAHILHGDKRRAGLFSDFEHFAK